MPSNYKLRPEDSVYSEEFHQSPIGHHSPGPNRTLTLFRGEPTEGKYVLVCREPHQEWVLGQLSGQRGKPVTVFKDGVLRDRNETGMRAWPSAPGDTTITPSTANTVASG